MPITGNRSKRSSEGTTIVLFAVMMPVIIGGLALSVDTAVTATAKAQLQTAADAAALAGARHLALSARLSGSVLNSSDIQTAHNQAIAAATRNTVLGVAARLLPNAANTNTGSEDVVVGYFADLSSTTESLSTASTLLPYANTVKVTARRDANHDGTIPNFFSRLWTTNGSTPTVTSAATVKGLIGFKQTASGTRVNLLPIVLDQDTYKAMLAKTTTDQYTYNSGSNTVTNGGDGIHESMLFPVSAGLPGNWGTVNIGVSNNSTSTLGDQIRAGITPAQLATFPGGKILLDASLNPPSITFEGNPGISAGIKDDLTSIIGKPVRIPISSVSSGNGDNATYTVVSFAPVRVLSVNFQGTPKYVIIQPATVADDGTEVWGSVKTWPPDQQFRLSLSR